MDNKYILLASFKLKGMYICMQYAITALKNILHLLCAILE